MTKDDAEDVARRSCPLAFADLPAAQLWEAGALAQAGQGLARLLESYGEQAGGSASCTGGTARP